MSETPRRCEGCGRAMIAREHRQTHPTSGKKVCTNCLSANLPEWTMTYGQRTAAAMPEEWLKSNSPEWQAGFAKGLADAAEGALNFDNRHVGTEFGDGWDTAVSIHNDPNTAGEYWGTVSMKHHAHDSGDGETIAHCPFCGSGSLVGGADGTVECSFCRRYFTVQVQPEFAAMPQTINGQPFNIPGMPGGGPDAGAAQDERAQGIEDAQTDKPEGAAAPDPREQEQADKAREHQLGAQSMLVTEAGIALPVDAFIQRLALAHAEDRASVLAAIRQENGLTAP